MLDPFLTFINQHKLDLRSQSCLLAVSGGVDSIVLMHLFKQMAFPAAVAHCNFGLRGEESEGDEQFVKELSAKYEMPFFTKKFDIKSHKKEKSVSTQMAARELRYNWFEELRMENSFDWIVTAHHANDSLETTLLNLVRGTALSGLHGIASVRGHLLRPLLLATKDQILIYAQEAGLHWREDRSNDSDDYKRNRIRHNVVPVLKQLNPSLEDTHTQSAARLQSADRLLKEALDAWAVNVLEIKGEQTYIRVDALTSQQEPTYRLWHLLQNFGFSYNQAEKIVGSLNGIPGRQFVSDSHALLIDRKYLIVKEKARSEEHVVLPITILEGDFQVDNFSLRLVQRGRDSNPRSCYSKNTVAVDSKKIILPLIVRKWQAGDIFQPFGMKGKKKKLSDLFTDLKMDLFSKHNTFILLNGNQEIIWVIGIRLDERYRIDEHTISVLEMTCTLRA
jgi:tRNA(Ile)-lysidine synthase